MSKEEEGWLELAKKNKMAVLVILLDLDDKDIFPLYFESYHEFLKYQKNIISEWKVKILKVHEIF